MTSPRVQLAIFARAPIAGQCKTRLIPALGAEGAAQLHATLVEKTVKTALAVHHAEVTLWTVDKPEHPFFGRLATDYPLLKWQQQPEGDLGERMHHVFMTQQQPTLLMGSDCPVMTPALLQNYAVLLTEHQAVVVPAEDGGYVLIGLQAPCRDLFSDMRWGHEQVMQHTRLRLQQNNINWAEPECLWDVDRPEDLRRLSFC